MIEYTNTLEGIEPRHLYGFFVDWPNPPSPDTHLRLLSGSSYVVLAVDTTTGQVVGFVSAVSDRVLAAYIPLLEVLPAYQHQGIGSELMKRMLAQLSHLYAVDLLCDPELQPYYARFGMRPTTAMFFRNYRNQSGAGG